MKILFVCRGNVVRSQMAAAFYNRMSKERTATSAGTEAQKYEGRELGSYAFYTIACMKEIGYDISKCKARQITHEMMNSADKIIVMANKDTWPEFLKKSKKVEEWSVEDPNTVYKAIVLARNKIKGLVERLVEESQ
jgi:protein-tyrosine-phosphatase